MVAFELDAPFHILLEGWCGFKATFNGLWAQNKATQILYGVSKYSKFYKNNQS